jgi:murein hydrolase activator
MTFSPARARLGCSVGGALAALLAIAAARAETQAPHAADPGLDGPRLELRGVEGSIDASLGETRRLEGEIANLQADRERLTATLLEATERLQATEARAAEVEQRLDTLTGDEQKLVKSLQDRRALIGEVLAVLQRIGRRPPPALIARPEDILEAIRSSMGLSAVLPQMRGELTQLQTDLAALVKLRGAIGAEREKLAREKDALASQQASLQPMIEARRAAIATNQTARDAEIERARTLAAQATSLKDLIARMEKDSAAAREAAEAAKRADAARAAADAAASRETRAKALAQPFRDQARLTPAVAFADLKGRLPLPANGPIVKRYGAADGSGGAEKGLSIAARDNGIVVAPCDGWIAYSGPYRSYGQLLIINAGGGYYIVLAGMSRINASVGQFVLAGEPLASMGDGAAQTAATIAIGAKQPVLYVEFRKDGAPIDPSPWWAKSDIRKVGG